MKYTFRRIIADLALALVGLADRTGRISVQAAYFPTVLEGLASGAVPNYLVSEVAPGEAVSEVAPCEAVSGERHPASVSEQQARVSG